MPKLLQINVCYGYYSTGKIAENISDIVKSHGWKSYAAYRSDIPSKNTAILLPVGRRYGKYTHFITSLLFDRHGYGSVYSTKKLIKQIDEVRPDIIHLHNIHGYYLNFKLLLEYLKMLNIPIVITVHDCWLFTGHCAHFTKIGCEKWKTECHDCRLLKSYPRALIDNSKGNYNLKKELLTGIPNLHLVAVSQWLGNIVKESFLGDKDIRVIYNGIDVNTFRILDHPVKIPQIPNNVKIVLGVSSAWYEDKGYTDFLELSKILPPDVKVCLVGLSERQKQQLPSDIIGITKTTNVEELVALYNRAEAVISLSKGETFGLTLVEGFACGTPAVVYDNTALPELITPETGFVVPTGDINAVKEMLIKIIGRGKNKYSEACRRVAVAKYDAETSFQRYYDLYNEILAN